MTLNQLKAFYWAAKLGTFAIAAQRLHVTQSSLSKRIAELEADIGKPLFDRSGRRAFLTGAGEMLLAKAKQMLELEETIRTALALEEDLTGTCRLGLSELSATTWFPDFVGRLREEYPDLTLAPQVGLGRNLERLVERGELDLAIIAGTASSDAIASQFVSDVKFEWMSSPSRLRRGTLLKAGQFQQHPVISSTLDSGLTLAFDSWAASYGMKARQMILCNSLTAIIGLTVAGVGISFLPRRYVLPLVERNLLVVLRTNPPLPLLQYSLIWRRDDTRKMVALIKQLVLEEVDFATPNALWTG